MIDRLKAALRKAFGIPSPIEALEASARREFGDLRDFHKQFEGALPGLRLALDSVPSKEEIRHDLERLYGPRDREDLELTPYLKRNPEEQP